MNIDRCHALLLAMVPPANHPYINDSLAKVEEFALPNIPVMINQIGELKMNPGNVIFGVILGLAIARASTEPEFKELIPSCKIL